MQANGGMDQEFDFNDNTHVLQAETAGMALVQSVRRGRIPQYSFDLNINFVDQEFSSTHN